MRSFARSRLHRECARTHFAWQLSRQGVHLAVLHSIELGNRHLRALERLADGHDYLALRQVSQCANQRMGEDAAVLLLRIMYGVGFLVSPACRQQQPALLPGKSVREAPAMSAGPLLATMPKKQESRMISRCLAAMVLAQS